MENIEEINPNQIKVKQQQQQEKKKESNFTFVAINIETLKKKNDLNKDQQGPKSTNTSPKLRRTQTCLCSPTTHVGSFRCRFHRSPGPMIRGYSVGSKLSELAASKSPPY